MLLDPRNSAHFDLPDAAHRDTLLIAATPRTGSTLLCRTLWETGSLGCPKEYLNPMQLRDWSVRLGASAWERERHRLLRGPLLALVGPAWSTRRVEAHLHQVIARRTDRSGWFSMKLHAHHSRRFFRERPEVLLRPTRWIWVRRRDRLRQAISWVRALQSGRWSMEQGKTRRSVYSARQIAWALRQIQRDEAYWERVFKRQPVAPFIWTYEDALDDWSASMRAVYDHVQLPPPSAIPTSQRVMGQQADAESAEWAARFKADRTYQFRP